MDMESIRLFDAVLRCGSITGAAAQQLMTQSAASKRLRQLEEELGITLFYRGKGQQQVRLTPEGKAFSELAWRMLLLHEQALNLKNDARRHVIGIACINSAQNYSLPPLLSRCHSVNPQISFTLEDSRTARILELVRTRRVDVGIVQGAAEDASLCSVPLYNEHYRVVMGKSASCPAAGSLLKPADLPGQNEIFEGYGAAFNLWHDTLWQASRAKIRVNTTPTARPYLQDADSWILVPDCVARVMEQEGFRSYGLAVPTPPHPVHAVYRKEEQREWVLWFVRQAQTYFRAAADESTE